MHMLCVVQPLDGKSSLNSVCRKIWSARREVTVLRAAQMLRPWSPHLGFLRHISCSYRKGFICWYDIYSSCVSDSTGFFGFLFL